jgi:hypothetical protein
LARAAAPAGPGFGGDTLSLSPAARHVPPVRGARRSPTADRHARLTLAPLTSKTMRHALMYVGAFERNFPKLTAATDAFEGSDGQAHPYTPWPSSADGLRISYMEKAGKKFVAVRVADGKNDVVLVNELVMVPGEHFGFGVRLGPEPTLVSDDRAILKLLEDIIKKNAKSSEELLLIRARLKAAMNAK